MTFWESLQFEAPVPQLRTFHMDSHPLRHDQLIIHSNGRCVGYVALLECHASFEINWESFAHRDQQRKHV